MRKIKTLLLTLCLSLSFVAPAGAISVLPEFSEDAFNSIAAEHSSSAKKIYDGYTVGDKEFEPDSNRACKVLIDDVLAKFGTDEAKEYIGSDEGVYTETFLACGIKSGNIKFWMVPYYARHILSFLLGIAGLISVLMIIVGAYYYIAGGISEDKEKGKNVIKFALGGLVLTTLAWIIVNFILLLLTA